MSQDGFDTEMGADAYISKNKKSWGRDQGWYRVACDSPIQTREVEELGLTITEYECPQNYTVTKSDITTQRADEALLEIISKNRKCGESVINYINLLNTKKALADPSITTATIKSFLSDYSDIMNMLSSGSISTAIDEITNEPETALVTASDKTAIINKINSCKAN